MFGKRKRLFTLHGFDVKVDISWLVIAVLVTWSLARGYFPYVYEDLSLTSYWIMGIAGALGLFVAIILHEFSHSIVAVRYGMEAGSITLFIFGGVSETGEEPPSPMGEFAMSIVGPLTSIAVAAVCYGVFAAGTAADWPGPALGVVRYLAVVNGVLALFNLVPAFPLDGGRVLRSILWAIKKDFKWATRIASGVGSIFGLLLMAYGIWRMFQGILIGGMWLLLIGIFLQTAARISYQRLVLRRTLSGESVERFMKRDPMTIDSSMTVQQFLDDYAAMFDFKMYPVMQRGELAGCVTTKAAKDVSGDRRATTPVSEITVPVSEENSIHPQADASEALSRISASNFSRLLVVENGELRGVVTLKDMIQIIVQTGELEEEK
jgi:Zn-dependent protease